MIDDDKELEMPTAEELIALFEAPPPAIIGTGKNKASEMVEWTDPEEGRYNLRMGLDRNGEPLPADKMIAQEEVVYGAVMSEGYDLLDMDGDDEGAALYTDNDVMNNSGFNQW